MTDEKRPPTPLSTQLGILLTLAGALLIRIWHLGERSVWTDEGTAWTIARAPFGDILHLCIEQDASPPLFYLLTSVALRFGESEVFLRSVSVLASVGLVWLAYRIARLFAARNEATLAAALVALSSFQLMYAQEARTYALVSFFTVLSLYLFARIVLLGHRKLWLAFVLVTAAGMYTQSIAVLGIAVQAVFVLFTQNGRRMLGPWLLAQLGVLALYAPWIVAGWHQAAHLGQSHWYVATPDLRNTFHVVRAVTLAPIPLVTPPPGSPLPGLEALMPRIVAHLLLALIPGLALVSGMRAMRGDDSRARIMWLAFAGAVLPIAAVYLISFVRPLWMPRYFVLVTPFLAVVIARGIVGLPLALRWVWGILLLFVFAYGSFRYDTDYTKEPWRDVQRHIARESAADIEAGLAGSVAVLVPFDADPYLFYDARKPGPEDVYEVSHADVPFASHYTDEELTELEAAAARHVEDVDEVWVVVRSPNSPHRLEVAQRTERVASQGREEVERTTWDSVAGPLRVMRFRR